jgi:RNA polymerase sigma-70 factor (ECF subfamily)
MSQYTLKTAVFHSLLGIRTALFLWVRPLQFSTWNSGGTGDGVHDELDTPSGPDLNRLNDLDPEAVTEVHQLYYEVVYRYARYRLPSPAAAEDVAAETFVRLLEAIHARKGPRSSVRGWLMGTVSNLVRDYYRKAYSNPMAELKEDHQSELPGPETWIEDLESREVVQEALKELTEEQQHVLALRFGSGYSLQETARTMRKNVNAIKALQFRALAALRRQIGGAQHG